MTRAGDAGHPQISQLVRHRAVHCDPAGDTRLRQLHIGDGGRHPAQSRVLLPQQPQSLVAELNLVWVRLEEETNALRPQGLDREADPLPEIIEN